MALITTREMLDASGITYRQMQFWSARGWLQPCMSGERRTAPGEVGNPGYTFLWSARETACARALARLIDAGLTGPAAAEVVASLRAGERRCQLGPGVWVTVREARHD